MASMIRNINGSTLVETLVTFTILLICVSMAVMILNGIIKSSGRFDHLEAWLKMNQLVKETKTNQDYTEHEFMYKRFRIIRTFTPSGFSPSVYILRLKVIGPDRRVYFCYREMIIPDDEYKP